VHARSRIAVLAGVTCAAFTIPAAAQAATRAVTMGPPAAAQKVLGDQYRGDATDFFPHGVTIHVGDSVRFLERGFHTVDFPVRGADPAPFVLPGAPIANSVDAAGAPFWFNGLPAVGLNVPALPPQFGKTVTFSGAKRVTSGLPLVEGPPKPFTVRFTKRGSYTYYCNIHPGMDGKVRVVPKSRKIPNRAAYAARLRAQITRDVNIAKTLNTETPPAGTVSVGAAGAYGVEYYGMLPETMTVPIGTTLRFQMPSKSREQHTATFGPGDPEHDPASYLGQIAAGLNANPFDPRTVFPSEPPGALGPLTPVLHGNGFWNSGLMDASGATPLPGANAVTFGAPGTYTYFCMIHPFMKGTVVVQ
jgi:plastocyanin